MASEALASTQTGAMTIPKHVAIIMDGNGRWAAKNGVSRSKGHRKGADAVREAIEGAIQSGVSFLTLYAFSSENWNRPAEEVSDLMGLLRMYLKKEVRTLSKEGVKLRVIGRRETLGQDIRKMIEAAEHETQGNSRLTLVIALSYGSRDEIANAAKRIALSVVQGKQDINSIDEASIEKALFTHGIPDPDLIIRTSGEQRLSNFLLWQAAYAEFLFSPVLWPDFSRHVFAEAVADYMSRDRRFGARP